jgi:uncharacterized protein (TIGR03086 family)
MTGTLDRSRRTLEQTIVITSGITPDQLGLPTPCAGWDLRQLLGHMIGQHNGFAAAARGETSDLSVWADQPPGDDPAGDYAAATTAVIKAFSADGVLGRKMWLPEIREGGLFRAELAIGFFHFIDYVVHGWDVAAAIGVEPGFDPDLVHAALEQAARVPGGDARLGPGAAFRPGVTVPQDAPELDRVVAMLGRSPDWTA